MSLAGLKFVGKKVEKKDETEAKPAAQAGGGIKLRASMDWMSGPIDLLGRRPEELPPPPDAATLAKQAEEDAAAQKLQEEIDKGLRDKSGMLYGLNIMSKEADGGPMASVGGDVFVGDNGASWRARALKRAKEEAHKTGKPLEEVVRDRWGSLSELKKGLDGSGTNDRRKGWKKQDLRGHDDDRKRRDEEGWRRVFSASSGERKPRLSVGREQTEKEVLSRFSQKLNEALGKVEDGEGEGEGKGRKRDRSRSRDRERDWREGKRRERSRDREDGRRRGRDEGRRRGRSVERDDEAPLVVATEDMEVEEPASAKGGRDTGVAEEKGGSRRPAGPTISEPAIPEPPAAAPAPAKEEEEEEEGGGEGEEDEDRSMAERRARRAHLLAEYQARAPPPAAAPKPKPVVREEAPKAQAPGVSVGVDPNRLAAQALKAKLRGDRATYDRLMKEAEDARKGVEAAKAERAKAEEEAARRTAEEPTVVVPLDRHGRPIQLSKGEEFRREDMRRGALQGKLKKNDKWGQDVELEELVRREKMGGDDMDAEFARNIVRLGSRFRGTEQRTGDGAGMDEEDHIDTRMFEKSEDRLTDKQRRKKQEAAAVRELGKWEDATMRCSYCKDGQGFKRHLMLSLGNHAYLMLRTGASALVPGHCAIVPIKHIESIVECDEEVVSEVDRFKAALRQLYGARGKGVLFLDTSVSLGRKRHAAIEAIPVPRNAALDAPLYFKQGLMEVDEQWATHKKLIETKGRNIRSIVPRNFPYFHVDWGAGGYAHVVEDKDQFPMDFGVGVVAGMLGVAPPRFDRKAQRVDAEAEKKAVLAFVKEWQPFDWTAELDGGAPVG